MHCVASLQCMFFRLSIFFTPNLACIFMYSVQPCFICHPQMVGLNPELFLVLRWLHTLLLFGYISVVIYRKLEKPNLLTMYPFLHSRANNQNISRTLSQIIRELQIFMKLYALVNEKIHFTCNNFEMLRCSFPYLDRMQICTGTHLKESLSYYEH